MRRCTAVVPVVLALLSVPLTAQENEVQITERGLYRYLTSNGIPDHETGRFPNRGNPHEIEVVRHEFRMLLEPRIAGQTSSYMGSFGVGINGIPFDPGTAEYYQGDPKSDWRYEALSGKINLGVDDNNAHVQPNGAYHYHGMPKGLLLSTGADRRLTLIGYAADGFGIYGSVCLSDPSDSSSVLHQVESGYVLKKGRRPGGANGPGGTHDGTFVADWEYLRGAGNLDECNGHVGKTPEHPKGVYHYHLTDEFPFVPRMTRGEPDPSFVRKGGPAGAGPGSAAPERPGGSGRPPPRRKPRRPGR